MEAWWPTLMSVARIFVVAFAGFAVLVLVVQRRLVFPGALRISPRSTASAPQGAEQLWLETEFGRVEAWLFAAAGEGRHPAVIFAHGNGELLEDSAPQMREMADSGVSALSVEFPGYGHSEGEPTRRTIRRTFQEAFDRLASGSGVDPGRIVAWGRSLGGGAAGDLALDRQVAGLIFQSTFSSTAAAAHAVLVPGFLVRDRWDNVAAVRDFDGPVLVMHGPDDDVLPFSHARRLARARPGLQVTPIDCAHNDCARAWPEIRDLVLAFLREQGLLGPTSRRRG